MNTDARQILEQLQSGAISVDEALLALKKAPFADIGYAKVDLHRKLRQGAAEVVYGAGKTVEQIAGILNTMLQNGQDRVLITRLDAEKAEALAGRFPLRYDAAARIATLGEAPRPDGLGYVVVATGGTSDVPVAEEAAMTAEFLGSRVVRLYDVGVAGLHRESSRPRLRLSVRIQRACPLTRRLYG